MACWRTKGHSNCRYNSENMPLTCRRNFRSCAAKWPTEKNSPKRCQRFRLHLGLTVQFSDGEMARPRDSLFHHHLMHLAKRIHAELNQVLRSQLGLLFAAATTAERIAVKWRAAVSFHLAGREGRPQRGARCPQAGWQIQGARMSVTVGCVPATMYRNNSPAAPFRPNRHPYPVIESVSSPELGAAIFRCEDRRCPDSRPPTSPVRFQHRVHGRDSRNN